MVRIINLVSEEISGNAKEMTVRVENEIGSQATKLPAVCEVVTLAVM